MLIINLAHTIWPVSDQTKMAFTQNRKIKGSFKFTMLMREHEALIDIQGSESHTKQ